MLIDETPRAYQKLTFEENAKLEREFKNMKNINEKHMSKVASDLNLPYKKVYKWNWDKKNQNIKK